MSDFKKDIAQETNRLRRRVRRLEILEIESGSSSGSGEVNAASNAGVGGYGWYIDKPETTLRFKNIIAASAPQETIYLIDDTGEAEIEVGVIASHIGHNSLSDIGASDHHAAFVGLLDNAMSDVDPRSADYRIWFSDDDIINADVSDGSAIALTIDQAQISHDSIGDVSEDDHHTAFVGLADNADASIDPDDTDDRIQITDDGVVNADAAGNTLALSVDQSQISHDSIGDVSEDDHHAAFIGLEDNANSDINPAADNRIQVTDDGAINADASGNTLALTIDQAQISHDSIGDVSEDDHHTAFVGLEDNANTDINPDDTDDRIQITDDGVINADASGNTLALSIAQAQISHDSIGDVSEDDHHAAFIGLEDNAATAITPAADNRIQITDDGIVNADASGNTLALSVTQSYLSAEAFYLHKNGSDQSITASTWTKLTWSTALFDTDSGFDNTNDRFTPNATGYWSFHAVVQYNSMATGKDVFVAIRKNGTAISAFEQRTTAGTMCYNCHLVNEANGSTDYYEVWVYHADTVARNVEGTYNRTFFEGIFIGVDLEGL